MDLHPQCFAVCELVDEVTATVAPLVARNGNRLEVYCAGDAGAMDSDPLKLRQVLYNLLSNAAKFTQQGVIELRVRREAATGGDCLHFRVADTGAGMDPAQVARLFEPFFQGQAFLTRRVGGTGLGLAISRRFAELMGGDIQVASKPGEGSVFTVCLPADLPREGTTRLASHG